MLKYMSNTNVLLNKIIEIVEYKEQINQLNKKIQEQKIDLDTYKKILEDQKDSFNCKYNKIVELIADYEKINKITEQKTIEQENLIDLYKTEIQILKGIIIDLKNQLMLYRLK